MKYARMKVQIMRSNSNINANYSTNTANNNNNNNNKNQYDINLQLADPTIVAKVSFSTISRSEDIQNILKEFNCKIFSIRFFFIYMKTIYLHRKRILLDSLHFCFTFLNPTSIIKLGT